MLTMIRSLSAGPVFLAPHLMRAIHGLTRSLNQSGRFKYKVRLLLLLFSTHKTNKCSQEPDAVVDFLVIGAGALKQLWALGLSKLISHFFAGVVGLAVAQRLSQSFPSRSTCLLERHNRTGEETRYIQRSSSLIFWAQGINQLEEFRSHSLR